MTNYNHHRHPAYRTVNPKKKKPKTFKYIFVIGLCLIIGGTLFITNQQTKTVADTHVKSIVVATKPKIEPAKNNDINSQTAKSTPPPSTQCSTNQLSQVVIVSISQRHLWACDGTDVSYDSPVITGMSFLAADLTPIGTYHIYAKETNLVLRGSDSTGSWNDPVSYWMPFLNNQYGQYGFHDATWRPDNAFGNVSSDSKNASHGCVEVPLATGKWLYSWIQIGTAVTIIT